MLRERVAFLGALPGSAAAAAWLVRTSAAGTHGLLVVNAIVIFSKID